MVGLLFLVGMIALVLWLVRRTQAGTLRRGVVASEQHGAGVVVRP